MNTQPDPNCPRCAGSGDAVGELVDVFTGVVTLRNLRVPCDCLPAAEGIAVYCNAQRHYDVIEDAEKPADTIARLEGMGWTQLRAFDDHTYVGRCPKAH